MRRLGPSWLSRSLPAGMIALTLALGALGLGACATYRQDLTRARAHYDANEYEKALALLRVLEPDQDSFSDAEKAQYAYTRGMTDYRLASLANPGGVSDPKREFRSNARHWLAISAAIEKQTPGGLSSEEKDRLTTALDDLNHDVLGGADTEPGKPGDKPADKPADKPTDKPADKPADAPPRKPN